MHGRLDLHIGTHKTGSSTIQHVLRRNRAALARRGVSSIEFPEDFRPLMRRTGIDPAIVQQFRDFLGGAGGAAVRTDVRRLLSWEGFSGDPATGYANVDVVAEHLRQITHGMDVRIIVYLRRQDDFVESLYTQRIHEGDSLDFDAFVRSLPDGSFHWDRFVSAWTERFGPAGVLVRRYGAAHLEGPDGLVADFLATQGLPLEVLEFRDRLPRLNRGLSRLALETARRVHPRLDEEDRQRLRRRLQAVSAKQPFEDYEFFDAAGRRAFLDRYASSNARVARLVPGLAAGDPLFPPPADGGACRSGTTVDPDDLLELLARAMLDDGPA